MLAMMMTTLLMAGGFTISAVVEQSVTISAPMPAVWAYYSDRSVFQRHFPGIVSVVQTAPDTSVWTFEMTPPLSSPIRMSYTLAETPDGGDGVVFTNGQRTDNFMTCRARASSVDTGTTMVTIRLEISMTREKGSDFHFLAPIVGQSFISARMREQIEQDMGEFLSRTREELQNRFADGRR